MNLPECLKQLNPKLILYLGGDADTVKNWIKQLKKYKEWRAHLKSNIYNEGRVEIIAQWRKEGETCDKYMIFNQAPLNDFTKRSHGIR